MDFHVTLFQLDFACHEVVDTTTSHVMQLLLLER